MEILQRIFVRKEELSFVCNGLRQMDEDSRIEEQRLIVSRSCDGFRYGLRLIKFTTGTSIEAFKETEPTKT